jgi:ABC-type sugar transport system substrate-binding protein
MSTDEVCRERPSDDAPWEQELSRRGLLKLAGLTAGGFALAGTGSAEAAVRRLSMGAASEPLAKYTMAVSEPIAVVAITWFVPQRAVTAKRPGAGEKVITANSNLKAPLQHEQVASFIEKKVNAILFFLITAAGWEKDVKNATSKGIGAFNHSASAVAGMTQNAGLDQYGAGYSLGQVAASWMNKNKGGTGQWALLAITNDPQLILRGQGIAAAMKKYAPGASLVSTQFAQQETQGATAASNILQANPNLVMILSAGDDPAFGAYTVATGSGKTSSTDFFIGSCDGTDEALSKIGQGGIYQATSDFLFPFSATQVERDAEKFFRKKPVQPTRITSPITVTAANLKQIQALSKNPLAPNVQWVYKKYMKYSNYHLKTNEPFAHAFR